VLAAGTSQPRSWVLSHATCFFGPRSGARRGARPGARRHLLRSRGRWTSAVSSGPGGPRAPQRRTDAATCSRSSGPRRTPRRGCGRKSCDCAATTNRSRSAIGSGSVQGMRPECYPCLRSDRYRCIRSAHRLNCLGSQGEVRDFWTCTKPHRFRRQPGAPKRRSTARPGGLSTKRTIGD
jgi:hypothetical protein